MKINKSTEEKIAAPADTIILSHKVSNHTMDEKYRDQFTLLTINLLSDIFHSVKENAGDYKSISNDENLPSVDKALGKRKVLAADIGIGIGSAGGFLGLTWLAKKIFRS